MYKHWGNHIVRFYTSPWGRYARDNFSPQVCNPSALHVGLWLSSHHLVYVPNDRQMQITIHLTLKKEAAVIWLRNCRYGVKNYIINELKKKYKLKTEIQLVNKNYVCKFAMCCVPTVFVIDILINFKTFYFNVIRVI